MKTNERFVGLSLEFWANVKLLNQKLGYVVKKRGDSKDSKFVIPTKEQIIEVFNKERLDFKKLVMNDQLTDFGKLVVDYFFYRADVLSKEVYFNLQDKDQAKALFESYKVALNPKCPLPLNKQTGDKRDYAFLTGLVNMVIEANIKNFSCDFDPRQLTSITDGGFPVRTLSRRVDGAFPSVKDPIAIWEIKEYYYTTTFGSRVADGVYETQLDGWELWEAQANLNVNIRHYLIVDDVYTWWDCGRSYLCRLIDSMHMGLVTEVIFGREVVERLPLLVTEWIEIAE